MHARQLGQPGLAFLVSPRLGALVALPELLPGPKGGNEQRSARSEDLAFRRVAPTFQVADMYPSSPYQAFNACLVDCGGRNRIWGAKVLGAVSHMPAHAAAAKHPPVQRGQGAIERRAALQRICWRCTCIFLLHARFKAQGRLPPGGSSGRGRLLNRVCAQAAHVLVQWRSFVSINYIIAGLVRWRHSTREGKGKQWHCVQGAGAGDPAGMAGSSLITPCPHSSDSTNT